MDPPRTPTPSLRVGRPPRQSPSSSSPRRHPQRDDYPLSTDSRIENGPMGTPHPEPAPNTSSGTRLETPAPENAVLAKPSKTSKRKKNRHRKRRNRQQSFLTPAAEESHERSGSSAIVDHGRKSMEGDRPRSKDGPSYFNLGRNLSNTSMESDALLDHRYAFKAHLSPILPQERY